MNTKSLLHSLVLVTFSATAQSATVLYGNSADFNTALGGAAAVTQDFNSYAHNTSLVGVDVLPAVQVTGNFSNILTWDPLNDGDVVLFGYGALAGSSDPRNAGDAYYDIVFSGNYNAFAFDITTYDPATPGNGVLEVFSTTGYVAYDIGQTGALESDPIFVGLVTDGFFTSIRWNEGPEFGGGGNEETGLDNMIAANVPAVPVPAALPLMLSGVFAMGLLGRRKRA